MVPILIFTFLAVLLLVIFPGKNKTINSVLLVLVAVLLIAVAGFRTPGSDRDYLVYKYYWDLRFLGDVEYSFLIIKEILKNYLGLPMISIFIFYAVLGVYFKVKAIKLISSSVFISILIYISNYYLVHELTQIRAGVAAGLFLISVKYIYERNIYKFLILISLAGFFHYSAFLALPLYFLKHDDKNLKYYFFMVPLGFVIYFLGIDVIAQIPIPYVADRIKTYETMRDLGIGGTKDFNVFSFSFLTKISIFLMLYFNKTKIIVENKYAFILLKIYGISLFLFPILAEIPAFAYRVQSLFGIVDVVLVPLLITLFRYKFIGYFVVILIAVGFFFYNLEISELIK